jgi:hypothetical protein
MLAAVVLLLAGCGSGGGSGSSGGADVLSKDDLKKVLLTNDNVGSDFVVDEDDEDDDPAPGCLDALDDLDKKKDDVNNAEANYEGDNEVGLPSILSGAASFESTRDATELLDDYGDAFDDCTSVDEEDDEGTVYDLEVSTDTEKSTSDADQQLNVHVTGTISSDDLEFPLHLNSSVVRVDNHVLIVATGDIEEEDIGLVDPLTELAVSRLLSVIDDEEPTDETVEASGGGLDLGSDDGSDDADGEGEGDDETFESLPLDGGSFTWDSTGVTMTMSVEKVEPWGKKDDFCGDGSCGIANPDDTRFVLKYEVTVPAEYSEPFDPYACPGELHSTSGADDEALGSVSGDNSVALGGKVFPGETKFGVDEYYIEKAYADSDFYIESSCGTNDEDYTSAYFVGPITDVA